MHLISKIEKLPSSLKIITLAIVDSLIVVFRICFCTMV